MQPAVERRRGVGPRPIIVVSKTVAGALVAATLLGASAMPGAAQSLFQSLFGYGSPPPARIPPPQAYPMRQPLPSYVPFQSYNSSDSGSSRHGGGGGYRTVCVRMCDGFFYPMSNNASRSQFTRDARSCQANCGSDARLFYGPASDPAAERLVDLTGRSYTSMANAFRYRKSLVSGCACKAAPWSEAELTRHQRYADAEAIAQGKPLRPRPQPGGGAMIVAGGEGAATAGIAAGEGSGAAASVVAGPVGAPAVTRPLSAPAEATEMAVAETESEAETSDAVAAPRARPKPIVVASRPIAPLIQPSPRPAPKTIAAPATGPAKAPRPAGASALGGPVYSHDLNRFVFPGERVR